MKDLLSLDINCSPKVNQYLSSFPPVISEHTFTNLFAWRQTRPVWLLEKDGSLLFLIRTDICQEDQLVLLGPPVGQHTLDDILTDPELNNVIGAIRITSENITGLPDNYVISEDRNNSDYVYRVNELSNLSGRKYSKKRNKIKQCLAKYDCLFEKINDRNIEECRDLLIRWCNDRQCDLNPGLCGESRAITTTLDLFDEFRLLGGVVRVDGHIQAFSIGEKLNDSTAVWHFEKAHPDFNGLSQLINQLFARECLQGFEFVNREQDLGIPGLRQAKESYYPDHLVEKFTVFRE